MLDHQCDLLMDQGEIEMRELSPIEHRDDVDESDNDSKTIQAVSKPTSHYRGNKILTVESWQQIIADLSKTI